MRIMRKTGISVLGCASMVSTIRFHHDSHLLSRSSDDAGNGSPTCLVVRCFNYLFHSTSPSPARSIQSDQRHCHPKVAAQEARDAGFQEPERSPG